MKRITVLSVITIASLFISTAIQAAGVLPPMVFMKGKVSEARKLLGKKVVAGSDEARKVDAELRRLIDPVLNFAAHVRERAPFSLANVEGDSANDLLRFFERCFFTVT